MCWRQSFWIIHVLLLGLFVVGCAAGPKAKHDRALARARTLIEKQDYTRAVLECRTAIQAMPNDAEAYYELGVAYSHSDELQNAVFSYQQALRRKPGYEAAQIGLAEIMASTVDSKLLKQAQANLEQVVQSDATNTDALDTLALAELKLGEKSDAEQQLNRALAVAPRSLRSSILLAEARVSDRDYKGAENVLRQACEHDPASSEARVALATFYFGKNRTAEAEQALAEALKLNPNNATALLTLARIQLHNGENQSGEQSLQHLSLLPGNSYAAAYGLYLFQTGRQEEGLREFQRLARADENDRAARSRVVAAYWSLGRKEDAKKLIHHALAKNSQDTDALLQSAEMYIAERKYKEAQAGANAVLSLNGTSAAAHLLLASVYDRNGNTLLQRQELEDALRLQPASIATRLRLAELLINTKAANSALQILDDAPAFQKNSLAWLEQRNWALLGTGNLEGARKGIDAGLAAHHAPELLLQDAVYKFKTGQIETGRAVVQQLLRATPGNVRALELLYASYVEQQKAAAGAQKIKDYAAKATQSGNVQMFAASVLMRAGDYDSARAAYQAVRAVDPGSHVAQVGLIQVDMARSQNDAALEKVKALLAVNANDVEARQLLAGIEVKKGDDENAINDYQKVVAADPNNAQALNNLAYLLTDYKKQPDAALSFAQKAQQLAPTNPNYNDTVGWIFYQKGMYSLALKKFEEASANPSAGPVCSYHLAMVYARLGQPDRGRIALSAALKRNPKLPEAHAASQLLAQ